MKTRRVHLTLLALVVATITFSFSPPLPPVHAQTAFADPAFERLWTRTDQLVTAGAVSRSYYWGPAPSYTTSEDYAQGAGGQRLVQYFDKGRMEINNPQADKSSPFYVTSGLLTEELVSGKLQVGDSRFLPLAPAGIAVAGDQDDALAPTYQSFHNLLKLGPHQVGQFADYTVDRSGHLAFEQDLDGYQVRYTYVESTTHHAIPTVFWNFLNLKGEVVDGKPGIGLLADPWFLYTGYPITEAYWTKVKVGGKPEVAVLIQLYQRRVLTYTPTNADGWKVEMGNIGGHYYQWRYGADKAHPLALLTRCGSDLPEGFGRLWVRDEQVRQVLSCPTDEATQGPGEGRILTEKFEHGLMVDIVLYPSSRNAQPAAKYLYVLFDDGTVTRYPDNFVDGSSEPQGQTPAPGSRYLPRYGFGKLWRENGEVRSSLGWAISEELGLDGLYEYRTTYQFFPKGLVLLDPFDLTKLYVLYGSSTSDFTNWRRADAGAPPALPNCTTPQPTGSFGQLWSSDLSVQNQVGCPVDAAAQVIIQHFQYGVMLHLSYTNNPWPYNSSDPQQTYFLFGDGQTMTPYTVTTPVTLNPPPGLYAPSVHFSGYYAHDPELGTMLGWATGPEVAIRADDQSYFETGLMFRDGGRIYIMFSDNFYDKSYKLWLSFAE